MNRARVWIRDGRSPWKLARGLFVFLGLFWGTVSVWALSGGEIGVPPGGTIWWVMVLGLFGDAAAMFFVAWGLGRNRRVFAVLGLGLLAANGFLTFADQIGWLDLVVLIPHAAAFIALMLAMRTEPAGR